MLTSLTLEREAPPTCVWMDAGVLTYRLCDRDLDCENCPLDLALHGASSPCAARWPGAIAPPRAQPSFPDDRIYFRGHTWLRPAGVEDRFRFGLDGFAGLLVSPPRRIRAHVSSGPVRCGQTICTIHVEEGALAVGAPMDAQVLTWNDPLFEEPQRLAADPCGRGWLAELRVDGREAERAGSPALQAADRARMDFRRFLRQAGRLLLLDHGADLASLCARGSATDLRRVIGGEAMLVLLREMIF